MVADDLHEATDDSRAVRDDLAAFVAENLDRYAETGYRAVDVGYALFAHDDHVREGTLH
ncbi:hypothetical protein [Halorubrum sp. AS12]|uniref:hypothetical protein n=1 Tax=Halorubrum sp. AS12 TaxID=3409687 RepID=UPI003DA70EDC